MKILKLLFSLLTVLFFTKNMFLNQKIHAEEVNIDEYERHYVLEDRPSIVYGIIIDENKFQIILNNDQPLSEENPEEVYADEILTWISDIMRPGGALVGNLDPTAENVEIPIAEELQTVEVHFTEIIEAPQFPSYKLVFTNPEYKLMENRLIIKFQGNRIWEFIKGNEEIQLEDGKNSVFRLTLEE